ncbi:MAG: TerC/Alx family metal homeostasis membrane protein [Candidatus Spyradosoma sp.]
MILLNFFAQTAQAASELACDVPTWAWLVFGVFIVGMLALDLGVFHRNDRAVPFKDAVLWSVIWVGLAAAACALVGVWHGSAVAELFAAGYLLELSLSVDNLFVFLLIFSFFKVPDKYMHRVLFWGIIGAVIFRALFIFGGVALVTKFSWMMYLFGVLLVYTGVKMFFPEKKDADLSDNPIVRAATKTGRFSKELHGHSFFFLKDGAVFATPLFLVLIVIELSDVMFAVDSVPAILGVIPKNAAPEMKMFLAFTSNIFAILGLRSFFFALSGVMKMLRFLRFGLGVILVFIGVKLFLAELDWWHPSTQLSLAVLFCVLTASVLASAFAPKKKTAAAEAAEPEALPPKEGDVPANASDDDARTWIGVDLDGTLAAYDGWRGLDHVGRPVPVMLARVRHWLANGYRVKIVTARASDPEKGIPPVKRWLAENGLPDLEVTNRKDFDMIELWDDRAIQVVRNSGRPFLSLYSGGRPKAPILPDEAADATFYLLKPTRKHDEPKKNNA